MNTNLILGRLKMLTVGTQLRKPHIINDCSNQTPECVDGFRTLLRLRTHIRKRKHDVKRIMFENKVRKRNCKRFNFENLCA